VTRVCAAISGPDHRTAKDLAHLAKDAGADLVELRIDQCVAQGAEAHELVRDFASWPLPVLATNRLRDEGGDWHGPEAQRLALLLHAEEQGAAIIDVELAAIERLPRRPQHAELLLSYHDFSGMGDDLTAVFERMCTAGCDYGKLAVTPQDGADLDPVARLCERYARREDAPGLIAIGMGEVGLPTRLLAGAWGCAMTFGRVDDEGSAPGQPHVKELRRCYQVHKQGAQTCIFGVLGDPVRHSLSPLIHNHAFHHDKLDAVYVPFLAHDALGFWRACRDWIDGLSITIPHKQALIGEMDEVEELAWNIGAINTIYRDRDGHSIGANTDAPAAVGCVEELIGEVSGRRVLLLGAGGASRAIAYAMHTAGARVCIANRSRKRGEELAAEIGCTAIPLEDAPGEDYEVLINATSVGMEDLEQSPWPADRHRPDSIVFDTVYTPLDTCLLRDAQRAGCRAITGLHMLIQQAMLQYQRWTGLEAPEPIMHRVALEALSTKWTQLIAGERAPSCDELSETEVEGFLKDGKQ